MRSNYVKKIIDDYCVLDTETTGLSPSYCSIIEIGILKVRNNQIVDKYSQLIEPPFKIEPFITSLTGISNRMVAGKPKIQEVKDLVLDFIGNDIILGHNTNFDIRFLNASFNDAIDNLYMDTMQFARKLYPELSTHSLTNLVNYLSLSNNEHRALADCIATKELYDVIKNTMNKRGLGIQDLWRRSR